MARQPIMRMVNFALSRIFRCRPNSFLRLQQNGTQLLNRQARTNPLWHSSFVSGQASRRTAATSSIADSAEIVPHPHPQPNEASEASLDEPELPTAEDFDYGRWNFLWLDKQRLKLEAHPPEPGQSWLLVDDPDNANDFHLWLCILNFRLRKDGASGAAAVMEALMARGSLFMTGGETAKAFWRTMIEAAPEDRDLLESIWAYAEWLYDKHNTQLPGLYISVISGLVRTRRWRDVLEWHFRLSPKFGPDATAFTQLLRRFIKTTDMQHQQLLKALYHTSPHHQLYDEIIPFLYKRGLARVARHWRELLLCHGDVPLSHASRPFLRFLRGYYPDDSLHERELLVAQQAPVEISGPVELKQSLNPDPLMNVRELNNRAKGLIYGIKEKTYNDEYGAKYFATTWVSLDFAMESLVSLGMSSIGPLTLQAIALREKTCKPMRRRLEQLEEGGINVSDSSYTQALRYWVMTDDQRMLTELIHSDVHPSVFDDVKLERDLLRSSVSVGNQGPAQLAMSVRLIASANLATTVSNELLLVSLKSDNKAVTLRVLDSMSRHQIKLSESTGDAISLQIVQTMDYYHGRDASFYACVCSMLLHLQFTLPSAALRIVLYYLISQGRFDEFQLLASEAIEHHQQSARLGISNFRVHKIDVPTVAQEEGEDEFQTMSASNLNLGHEQHPIQLIFDDEMKRRIIRQGFRGRRVTDSTPRRHFTDGIHLLAQLRNKGIITNTTKVKKHILSCIVDFWRPLVQLCPMPMRNLLRAKGRQTRILRAVKILVTEAWGVHILPSLRWLIRDVMRLKRLGPRGKAVWEKAPAERIRFRKVFLGRSRWKKRSLRRSRWGNSSLVRTGWGKSSLGRRRWGRERLGEAYRWVR